MPIKVSWFDDKKSVILCEFEGHWTWQEYSEIELAVWNAIVPMDYQVDLLLDWTQSGSFPLGLMDIIHRTGEKTIPKRDDSQIINVSESTILKVMYGGFRRMYPKVATNYHLTVTLDEAIQLLEAQRSESITQSISAFKQGNGIDIVGLG